MRHSVIATCAPTDKCKGIIFLYRETDYLGEKPNLTGSITLLERDSCSGCQQCRWYLESASEILTSGRIMVADDLKDLDKCSIRMVKVTTYHKTGHANWYELFKIK